MYTLPARSTATSLGLFNDAEVAGPPSPLNPCVSLPAIVLMIPAVLTLRIRLFPRSVMYTLPVGSTATSLGLFNDAEVAGPPSPLNPCVSLPAIVLMIPAVLTLRIRLLPSSAMYTFPAGSTATPTGKLNSAEVAGPPSPLNPSLPLPAIVVMIPAVSTLRIRRFPASAMYTLPAGSTATPLGSYNEAEVAGPPSPLNPCLPLPAMVLMIPAVLTLRIRLLPSSAMYTFPAGSTATPRG